MSPWEDSNLSKQDRYDQYKEFLLSKVEALIAAYESGGLTADELVALANDPDNKEFLEEVNKLLNETPEQFCFRLDGGLHRELLGKNFLGAEEWKRGFNVDVGPVPPIPKWITKKLLEEECQLHPGEQVKDTHILVLVPKRVNGEAYSALKLGELCAGTKGSGDKLIFGGWEKWKKQHWAQAAQAESEWVLIPKSDPKPAKMEERYPSDWAGRHFRSKSIAEQAEVHKHYEADYREARALEVMTAALLNDVVNGEPRILDGWNFLRCVEPNASGGRVEVGYFDADGLGVHVEIVDNDADCVGRSLARKSKS